MPSDSLVPASDTFGAPIWMIQTRKKMNTQTRCVAATASLAESVQRGDIDICFDHSDATFCGFYLERIQFIHLNVAIPTLAIGIPFPAEQFDLVIQFELGN